MAVLQCRFNHYKTFLRRSLLIGASTLSILSLFVITFSIMPHSPAIKNCNIWLSIVVNVIMLSVILLNITAPVYIVCRFQIYFILRVPLLAKEKRIWTLKASLCRPRWLNKVRRSRKSWSRCRCYQTLCGRNWRISQTICLWQFFPKLCSVCGWDLEPSLEWRAWKVLHSGRLQPYLQTLD